MPAGINMFPDIPEKNLGASPSSHKLLGYVESEYKKTVDNLFPYF